MRPSTPVPFGHYKTHKTHKTPPPSNGFGSCVDQSSISLDRSATSSKAWGGATNPNSIRFNPTTQPRTPQSMKFFNEISDWKGSFQTKWWKDLCTFNNKKDCQPSIDSKNMWLIIIFTCRIQRKQNWTYLQKTRFVYTKKILCVLKHNIQQKNTYSQDWIIHNNYWIIYLNKSKGCWVTRWWLNFEVLASMVALRLRRAFEGNFQSSKLAAFLSKTKAVENLNFICTIMFSPFYVFPNYLFISPHLKTFPGLLQQAECFLPWTSILRTHICQGWISIFPLVGSVVFPHKNTDRFQLKFS